MLRYLPLALVAVAIVGVTLINGSTTNRWSGGSNAKAEACAAYLKLIPSAFGSWQGEEDEEVDERIKTVAGSVGAPISRTYRNAATGEAVSLWMIVGHSSQIIRHTPDVCYPAAGFRPEQPASHCDIELGEDAASAETWTGLFLRREPTGEMYRRVFWAWHEPRVGEPVSWEAPGHRVKDARDKFAGGKALYKIYFTSAASGAEEDPNSSTAYKFAQEFLPMLNELLAGAAEGPPQSAAAPAAGTPAGDASAEAESSEA